MTHGVGAAALPFEERDDLTFDESLRRFQWRGASTVVSVIDAASDAGARILVNAFTNEFWTAKQRAAQREEAGTLSDADRWIRMVAVNRLTGHSAGFFSVYTLPPNQAVSPRAQAKINERLEQKSAK